MDLADSCFCESVYVQSFFKASVICCMLSMKKKTTFLTNANLFWSFFGALHFLRNGKCVIDDSFLPYCRKNEPNYVLVQLWHIRVGLGKLRSENVCI